MKPDECADAFGARHASRDSDHAQARGRITGTTASMAWGARPCSPDAGRRPLPCSPWRPSPPSRGSASILTPRLRFDGSLRRRSMGASLDLGSCPAQHVLCASTSISSVPSAIGTRRMFALRGGRRGVRRASATATSDGATQRCKSHLKVLPRPKQREFDAGRTRRLRAGDSTRACARASLQDVRAVKRRPRRLLALEAAHARIRHQLVNQTCAGDHCGLYGTGNHRLRRAAHGPLQAAAQMGRKPHRRSQQEIDL